MRSDMMRRRFRQVDVFSDRLGYGNPLAVVADADDLADDEMARFARWTNLSETTFLLQPTQAGADYRVRIFTPGGELPFAGHPTIGSCHTWLALGGVPNSSHIVQECGVGLVQLRRDGDSLAFTAPPLRRRDVPSNVLSEIAAALGSTPRRCCAARSSTTAPTG
jgi:PhzF family phenazine biosynthesis protein